MKNPEQWVQFAKFATGRQDEPAVAPSGPRSALMALDDRGAGLNLSPRAQPRAVVSQREVLQAVNQLHREHGRSPSPGAIEAERMLASELRSRGFAHRHRDALTEAAQTTERSVQPLDFPEVHAYADDALHIESDAVSLIKSDEPGGRRLYLRVSKALQPLRGAILTKINRALPPNANLQHLPTEKRAPGRLVHATSLYDLQLLRSTGPTRLLTWEALQPGAPAGAPSVAAAAAAQTSPTSPLPETTPMMKLVAAGIDVALDQIYTCKAATANLSPATHEGGTEERYVKCVVLEPGVVDRTRIRLADGTQTLGDTYSVDEVREAAYYYMENHGIAAFLHTRQGGTELLPTDVCLLENYLTDAEVAIGTRKVRAGTWVQAWRVYSDKLWQAIKAGKIKALSVGMWSKGAIEPAPPAIVMSGGTPA